MSDPFAGNWKLLSNENIDEYMKVMGAPWIARKMESATSPSVDVTVNGDYYKFEAKNLVMTMVLDFVIGQEYLQPLPDGSKKKSIVVREGAKKLVQRTQYDGFEEITTREVKGDELVMTLEAKGITAVRKFKRN